MPSRRLPVGLFWPLAILAIFSVEMALALLDPPGTVPTLKQYKMKWWAEKYTANNTGCPCFYDMMAGKTCACCKNEGLQCGFPMQMYCQKNKGAKTRGCPGIPNNMHTLSSTGHPCHTDKSRRNCAWCVMGAKQCGPPKSWSSANQYSVCVHPKDTKSCLGQPQDCKLDLDMCDPNAVCARVPYFRDMGFYKWKISRCACKAGYVGNGITCANNATGQVSQKDSQANVKLNMKLTTDLFMAPEGKDFPFGKVNDFSKELDKMFNDNGVCGAGCKADIVTCGNVTAST